MDTQAVDSKLTQTEDGKWHDENGKQFWRAGTLVYDRRQLGMLFFWLLVGSFTANLVIIGLPMMLPLQLMSLGFSTKQIAWLMSVGFLGAMSVQPLIGMWSDRTRSRWGRRRPFDLLTTPFWLVGLLLIPFVKTFLGMNVAVFLIGFAGAASVVVTFLQNDVIPGELMGRFVGLFRFFGFVGVILFQKFIFKHFDENSTAVWISIALIAFTFEMLMVYMVKEGEYPPPPPKEPLLKNVGIFVKEGFGSKFIWMLWLTLGMTALGGPAAATYFMIFFKNDLAMTSQEIGNMYAAGTFLAMVFAIPSGWFVDKFGPNLVWGLFGLLAGVVQILMYFFVIGKSSCYTLYLIYYGINMLTGASLLPMLFCHLPKEKFGQFNGVNAIVCHSLLWIGTMACGWIIAGLGDNYRVAFLYGGIIYLFVPVFLILMIKAKNPYAHLETSMDPNGLRGIKKKASKLQAAEQDV